MITHRSKPKKNPRYEYWRGRTFIIAWLAYAGFYLTRKSFSVAKVELARPEVMGMSNLHMALIDATFLTAYAVGQIIFGTMGDRVGPRRVVFWGMLCSALIALAMGMTSTAGIMIALFFLQGLCQASGWGPLAKNIGCFYSTGEHGRIMGWWMTSYTIGGAIALVFAGWAVHSAGWRYGFFTPALVLLAMSFLFLLLQRNDPSDVGLPPIEEYHGTGKTICNREEKTTGWGASWSEIREVLADRTVLLLALVYFFLKPIRYLLLFWSPLMMSETLGTNAYDSGLVSAPFELAGIAAVVTGGYVSDRIFRTRRMPPSILSLFILSALLAVHRWIPHSIPLTGTYLFLLGFFVLMPESLISGTAAVDFGGKKGSSSAAGMINCIGSMGAIVGVILPWLTESHGHNDWNRVFAVLSLSTLISALILIPKWNTTPANRE